MYYVNTKVAVAVIVSINQNQNFLFFPHNLSTPTDLPDLLDLTTDTKD